MCRTRSSSLSARVFSCLRMTSRSYSSTAAQATSPVWRWLPIRCAYTYRRGSGSCTSTPRRTSSARFSSPFAYTASACSSVPSGRSISGRDTRRKLSGFPLASARASFVETTSYGGEATRAASASGGRRARNGESVAMRTGILEQGPARRRHEASAARGARRSLAPELLVARLEEAAADRADLHATARRGPAPVRVEVLAPLEQAALLGSHPFELQLHLADVGPQLLAASQAFRLRHATAPSRSDRSLAGSRLEVSRATSGPSAPSSGRPGAASHGKTPPPRLGASDAKGRPHHHPPPRPPRRRAGVRGAPREGRRAVRGGARVLRLGARGHRQAAQGLRGPGPLRLGGRPQERAAAACACRVPRSISRRSAA